MRALVTGGGGFIGSALVRELVNMGFEVSSFSRGDYPVLRKNGVTVLRGDISDREAVLKACNNMDVVFHVAAKAGIWGSYRDYYETNVKGTENVVYACRQKRINWLVYTSSASVVFGGSDINGSDESLPYPPRPLSHYTATKALAEQYILNSNSSSLRTIALRPHIVLGPGDNHLLPGLLVQARAGKLRQIGTGRNQVDISFIDNVVAAHICAIKAIMENPEVTGRAFFVTNGKPVLLWETINRILERSGIDPIDRFVSVKTALFFSALAETLHKIPLIKHEPRLTRFLVHELSGSHWFNIDAARKLLNHNPEAGDVEKLISLTGIPPGEIK